MKQIIITLTATALLLAACNRQDTFSIEGTLQNGAGKTIYIEELTPKDGALFIDSIQLDNNGHFLFKYKMPYKTFYNLHVNEYDYVVLLPDSREKIKITGDYNHLDDSYEVSGSPESILLWQLQDYSNLGIAALKELAMTDKENKANLSEADYLAAKEKTDSIFIENFHMQREYVCNFITNNQGSLATLIALYKPFNVSQPLLAPEVAFDYYETVLEGLEETLPDNPHTIHFRNTVEVLRHTFGQPKEAATFDFVDLK